MTALPLPARAATTAPADPAGVVEAYADLALAVYRDSLTAAEALDAAVGALIAAPSAETLGAVFGRDHAVHVSVAPGRLADAIAVEAGRLAGFRKPAVTQD